MMQISNQGILEICEHEGIVPAPYLDSVGVWTWGIGHTKGAGDPDPAKMSKAMPTEGEMTGALLAAVKQFKSDLGVYEARVNAAVMAPLAQHEFDALVSFDFNTGGIDRAVLVREINRGNPYAADHFMGWTKPPEIRKRRTAEMNLFKTGNYDANGSLIPIWKTNGAGKLAGVLRSISGETILSLMNRPAEPAAPGSATKPEGWDEAFKALQEAVAGLERTVSA